MPKILMPYTVHLDNTLRVTPVSTLFYKGDSKAHRFELNVLSNGLQADLSGCTAVYRFYRLQDSTVVSNPASIESGKVVAVLDKACYDYIGRFALTISIQNGEEETTVFYGDGYMSGNRADTGITGDYVVYDVETLLAKIAEIDTAIANANTAIANANTATENANAAEVARADAEAERVAAENYRVGHESTRQMHENDRVAHEKTRISSETTRRNAETERAAAETARSDAETARAEAEQQRAAAEEARDAAEADRVAAEQARAAAERERADTFAGYEERIVAATPDDTTVNGRSWSSKKTVDSLCMPLEATGNPVQVYPVENYPLGVKVSWEPTQAGEGDPSPDNIRPITGRDAVSVNRAGKNLVNVPDKGIGWATNIPTFVDELNKLPAGKYGISFELTLEAFTSNYTSETAKATALQAVVQHNGGKRLTIQESITVDRNATLPISRKVAKTLNITEKMAGKFDAFYAYSCGRDYAEEGAPNGQLGTGTIKNIQIELSETPTAYEPYTGSTTDIALPETVYGGTLDVETGVVTETWKMRTITGDETIHEAEDLGVKLFYIAGNPIPKNDPTFYNTHYKTGSYIDLIYGKSTSALSSGALFLSANSADELRAYLKEQYANGTPVQIAHPLPDNRYNKYNVDKKQIAALSGVNTIYTDGDSLTVTGREDPRHTIVTLTDRIAALESAAAGV